MRLVRSAIQQRPDGVLVGDNSGQRIQRSIDDVRQICALRKRCSVSVIRVLAIVDTFSKVSPQAKDYPIPAQDEFV